MRECNIAVRWPTHSSRYPCQPVVTSYKRKVYQTPSLIGSLAVHTVQQKTLYSQLVGSLVQSQKANLGRGRPRGWTVFEVEKGGEGGEGLSVI